MRTQQRNKKLIYLCQKYQAGNITKYKPPIPIYENYAPTNSDSDLLSMGMDYSKRLRIKSDNKIGAMLTLENGDIITNLDIIDYLYSLGIRMITLTWNYQNLISSSNKD